MRSSPKYWGGFALVAICVVIALVIAGTVARLGAATIGLYAMLALVLYALLRFVQPRS